MTTSIDDLRLFYEVATAGTITAAARRLDLPKSTVSRRLIQFEKGVGLKLIHKTTRKITLTAIGQTLVERCVRVMDEVESANSFIESVTTNAAGTLRVTMATDFGIYWLADFFSAFSRRHPDIRLLLDFTGRRLDLIEDRIDVAIRLGSLTGGNLVARKIGTLTFQMFAAPSYLREAGTPLRPDDLANHRFVMLEAHTLPRPEIELVRGKSSARISLTGSIVSNSLGVVRATVASGGGLGLLPLRMVQDLLDRNQVVRVLPGWAMPPRDLSYVISSRKLLPAKTRIFIEELTAHFKKLT